MGKEVVAVLLVCLLGISSISIALEGPQTTALASYGTSGYYVIPSNNFEQDWTGITLANHLLNMNWTIFRTTENTPEYAAESFVVPIENQPVSQKKVSLYIECSTAELNVTVYPESRLFNSSMVQVIKPRIAVYYSSSVKWTAMLQLCLEELGFDIKTISANDIENGELDQFNVLAVGGGYHKHKSDLLTEIGKNNIRSFVNDGGGYFGSCGGAAFVMNVSGGLNMIAVERREMSERPAGINGPIEIKILDYSHPIWYGLNSPNVSLPPWYGGAFKVQNNSVTVLGTYGNPVPGFHNYDINTYEVNRYMPEEWHNFEAAFGKVLDPKYGIDAPAIVESDYGQGKVLITYPHPDTPGGPAQYYTVLANMIFYLSREKTVSEPTYSTCTPATVEELKVKVQDYIRHYQCYKSITDDINTFGIYNRAWTQTAKWNICRAKSSPFPAHLGMQALIEENLRYLNETYAVLDEIERAKYLSPEAQSCINQLLCYLTELEISSQLTEVDSRLPDFATDYNKLILYWRELEILRGLGDDVPENVTSNVTNEYNNLKNSLIGRWPTYSHSYNALLEPLDLMYYRLSNMNYKAQEAELWLEYSTCTRQNTFSLILTDFRIIFTKTFTWVFG